MSRIEVSDAASVPGGRLDPALYQAVLQHADEILEARGFFEFLGENDISIDALLVKVPFAAARIGGAGYSNTFAARRIAQHLAESVIAAAAQFPGVDAGALAKRIRLPLSRMRKLILGKEAVALERFHDMAKLLAEQLFGRHDLYRFKAGHPFQLDIFRLSKGVQEYTDYRPGLKTNALFLAGSAFATPIENATLEEDAAGHAKLKEATGAAYGVGLPEILTGIMGGMLLAGSLVPAIGLGALGVIYSQTTTYKTRGIHEVMHAIQFMILGSALNDGHITPRDFWEIMYDCDKRYAFGGGTEEVTDVAAYRKVMGDTFRWFSAKGEAYFRRLEKEGDEGAAARNEAFQKHLGEVREILAQEGYGQEAREAKDVAGAEKLAAKVEKMIDGLNR